MLWFDVAERFDGFQLTLNKDALHQDRPVITMGELHLKVELKSSNVPQDRIQ